MDQQIINFLTELQQLCVKYDVELDRGRNGCDCCLNINGEHLLVDWIDSTGMKIEGMTLAELVINGIPD